MKLGDVTFPGILILIKIILRVCIGQEVSTPNFVKAMQSLPLDIAFFTLSLFVAYDRVFSPEPKLFVTLVLGLVALSCVITLLCRWCETLLIKERILFSHFISMLNLGLSTFALGHVLSILN